MPRIVEKIISELSEAGGIAITAHERPDGDALGSALALARILSNMGKHARVVGLDPFPARYSFLVKDGEIKSDFAGIKDFADIIVSLDCAAVDRMPGDGAFPESKLKHINIDHHASNTLFGDINWIRADASSAGEMVYRLAKAAGWRIDVSAAEAIWVAMVTDTGRFSYENTSAFCLRAAADLVDIGVEPAKIEGYLYQSMSRKEMRLTERALSSLDLHMDGHVATVQLSQEDFQEFDCGPEHAQEISSIPRNIEGVEVGLFFYELTGHGRTKVSVRAKEPRDATELCCAFGGGGHPRAAGCALDGRIPDVKRTVLEKVGQLWYGKKD